MTWLKDNKKFTVFLVITGLLLILILLQSFRLFIDEMLIGTVIGAWIMGTKEWLDGKPDKL